jgi:hypothetical protein
MRGVSFSLRLLRNPITGIVGCCALAASGHAIAAPPSSVMNWRLVAWCMGSLRNPLGQLTARRTCRGRTDRSLG